MNPGGGAARLKPWVSAASAVVSGVVSRMAHRSGAAICTCSVQGEPSEVAEVEAAARLLAGRNADIASPSAADFPLPRLAPRLVKLRAAWTDRPEPGRRRNLRRLWLAPARGRPGVPLSR